jgi:hypothetical protein
MTPTLLPEATRNHLGFIRHALERTERPLYLREIRELFYLCSHVADWIDKIWEEIQESLAQGAEGVQLRATLEEAKADAEEALRLYAKLANAAPAAPFPQKDEDVSGLEQVTRRAETVLREVASLSHWLGAPPPRVDPTALGALATR